MIVVSCPLRISLVGGSTDNPKFLDKYGHGSVISFPSTLNAYVIIHKDVFGSNSIEHKYNINYSKRETVKSIVEIKNELVRNCFEYLGVDEINCTLTSDIFSIGSGLAASSAYVQALIKSIYVLRNENINEFEVCKIAEKIERKFNPLVGQQDFYGSLGGLKRINFYKDKDPVIKYFSTKIFTSMNIYLLYTGVLRNSTEVLESLDIDKSLPLIDDVEELDFAITNNDINCFNTIIRRSWKNKKQISKLICENSILKELDEKLYNDKRILSHKLCGAGNGGYFLIFTDKDTQINDYASINKINISDSGLKYYNLKNEFTRI